MNSLGTRIEATCLPQDNLRASFVQNRSRGPTHFLTAAGLAALNAAVRRRRRRRTLRRRPSRSSTSTSISATAGDRTTVLLTHQRAMGISTHDPAPRRPASNVASTHFGVSNGLQAKALGNDACYKFARAHAKSYISAPTKSLISKQPCRKSNGT